MSVEERMVRLGAIALWESDYDLQNWPRNTLHEIARLVLQAATPAFIDSIDSAGVAPYESHDPMRPIPGQGQGFPKPDYKKQAEDFAKEAFPQDVEKGVSTEGDTTTYICTRHGPHSGPTCWLCVAHRERTTDDKSDDLAMRIYKHNTGRHADPRIVGTTDDAKPDWWFHDAHGLHDEAHHQAHDPLHLCVPLWSKPPPEGATWPPTDDAGLAAAGDAATVAIQQKKLIAWCTTHRDLAWLYDDGSVGCYYCQVVETSSDDCEAVPLKLADGASDDYVRSLYALLDDASILLSAVNQTTGDWFERRSHWRDRLRKTTAVSSNSSDCDFDHPHPDHPCGKRLP